jgi:hypothetical protein
MYNSQDDDGMMMLLSNSHGAPVIESAVLNGVRAVHDGNVSFEITRITR